MKAQVNGTELFYEVKGRGRPLICLHGGLGLDHSAFLPWLEPLTDVAQLVLLDHRGNGRSSRAPLDGVTHATWADDAMALAEHLKLSRPAVLGHSYGSYIAQELALRHGPKLSGLILASSTPAFDYPGQVMANAQRKGTPEQLAALSAALSGPVATDEQFGEGWRAVLPMYFHRWEPRYAASHEQTVYSAAAFNHAFGKCLPSFNNVPRLSQIDVPTLVVTGDDDFITPVEQGAKRLAAGIRGAQLHVIPDAGHFPFVEQQDEFVRVVRDFLRALPAFH